MKKTEISHLCLTRMFCGRWKTVMLPSQMQAIAIETI